MRLIAIAAVAASAWWVSPNGALGGAFVGMFGHVPGDQVDTWSLYSAGLQFIGVYN